MSRGTVANGQHTATKTPAGDRPAHHACAVSHMAARGGRGGGGGSYPRETVEAFFIASRQGNQPLNADKESLLPLHDRGPAKPGPLFRFAEWERRVTAGERVPELDEEVREPLRRSAVAERR